MVAVQKVLNDGSRQGKGGQQGKGDLAISRLTCDGADVGIWIADILSKQADGQLDGDNRGQNSHENRNDLFGGCLLERRCRNCRGGFRREEPGSQPDAGRTAGKHGQPEKGFYAEETIDCQPLFEGGMGQKNGMNSASLKSPDGKARWYGKKAD